MQEAQELEMEILKVQQPSVCALILVILRFEIIKELIDNSLQSQELPKAVVLLRDPGYFFLHVFVHELGVALDGLEYSLGLLLSLMLDDAHLVDADKHQLNVRPQNEERVILSGKALNIFGLSDLSLKPHEVLRSAYDP